MAVSDRFSLYASEFVGTFFLCYTLGLNMYQKTALAPLSVGSMLMVLTYATGAISGAHFNPAITLGVYLTQRHKLNFMDALVYIGFQCGAAIVAGFLFSWTAGSFALNGSTTLSKTGIYLAEILFSTILVLVYLNVCISKQDSNNHYFGLAVGGTLMAAMFAADAIAGAGLNPAIALGVFLSNVIISGGGWHHLALFLICPFIGSILAALSYRVVRAAEYGDKRQ